MILLLRKLIPIFLILCFCKGQLWAFGPVSPTDSLEKVFESSLLDSVKYKAANLIMRHSLERDNELGMRYAILAYDLAKKLGKKERFAFHHNTQGLFLMNLGRYQEALKEYEEGLKNINLIPEERQKNNFHSSLLINQGVVYGHLGEIEQQQKVYLQAYEIAEKYDFISAKAMLCNNLSKLYLDLNNIPKSETYVYEALDIIKDLDYPHAKVLPYLNLGSLFLEKNQPDSAIKYFEVGLKHAEVSGSFFDRGAALIELSEYLVEQGQYERALGYAERALRVADELGNKELSILTDLAMAHVKRKMDNLTEAEFCVNRALSLLDEKTPLTELKIYEEMEKVAMAKADYKKAQSLGMHIRMLKDTLLDINRQNYMDNAESRLSLERMRTEGLEKDRKLAEQAIKQKTTVLGFSWLALFLALVAAVFLVRNIQQRKNYNTQLEETVKLRTEKLSEVNADLEIANFELKRFNRIISHDLKAPLNNIQGLLELVKEETGTYGEESVNLDYLQKSTNQLMRILEDLSLYYNFDKQELKMAEFSTSELIEGVKLALNCSLAKKEAAVSFSNMPVIRSYWTPLFLTFKNLVENAIKYNESDKPHIDISYERQEDSHVFSVSDNGIGISEDHFDKVFELFQRVSPSSKYNGTGLGLSISKKMIEEIGGGLRVVKSSLNQGSVFEVRLPLKRESVMA